MTQTNLHYGPHYIWKCRIHKPEKSALTSHRAGAIVFLPVINYQSALSFMFRLWRGNDFRIVCKYAPCPKISSSNISFSASLYSFN